jgi:hypothetical protein
MRDPDEEAAAHDLIAIIGLLARAIPIDKAVSILLSVVTELIQASPHAASYWDQVAAGVEGYRRAPAKTVSRGSSRLQ